MISTFFGFFGRLVLFLKSLYETQRVRPLRRKDLFLQIWKVSINSLLTVMASGFFVGAILVLQFTPTLKEFGALGFLGGLTTSITVREIGPLLIAFMLSGKIGAYTAAELGTLKVTEQVDALRCLGADPLQEVILPRFVAIIISSILLLYIGIFTSLLGGALMSFYYVGTSLQEYIRHIPTIIGFSSMIGGLLKCVVFAFTLALLCTYFGYHAEGGARGVGRAVVTTSMFTMVGIVITDWLTTQVAQALHVIFEGILL